MSIIKNKSSGSNIYDKNRFLWSFKHADNQIYTDADVLKRFLGINCFCMRDGLKSLWKSAIDLSVCHIPVFEYLMASQFR